MWRITYTSLLCLLLLTSVRADPVRWSEPRLLAPDTAAFVRQCSHSTDAHDTALWTIWVEDRGTGRRLLRAARFSNGSWLCPESISSDTAELFDVECAVDVDLSPWAVWGYSRSAGRDTFLSYNFWSRRVEGPSWTSPRLIAPDTVGGDVPAVCSDPEQGIWAVWPKVNFDSNYVSIFSSYCPADSWRPPSLVARFAWYFFAHIPVITAPPGGKVRSVWTGALGSGIGQYTSTWEGDSWSAPELVPGAGMGFFPSICSDSQGGTWVTWLDEWSSETLSVHYAYHNGTAWTETGTLASGTNVFVFRGMLCCDDQGRVWAMWTDRSRGTSDSTDICVRYTHGDTWSSKSLIATCSRMDQHARIATTPGRVYVTWTERETETKALLYYSHTLPSGVAEERGRKPAVVFPLRVLPSPARDRVWLAGADRAVLFSPDGRKAATLTRGSNDVRHLARGVYFCRSPRGRKSVRLVLVE